MSEGIERPPPGLFGELMMDDERPLAALVALAVFTYAQDEQALEQEFNEERTAHDRVVSSLIAIWAERSRSRWKYPALDPIPLFFMRTELGEQARSARTRIARDLQQRYASSSETPDLRESLASNYRFERAVAKHKPDLDTVRSWTLKMADLTCMLREGPLDVFTPQKLRFVLNANYLFLMVSPSGLIDMLSRQRESLVSAGGSPDDVSVLYDSLTRAWPEIWLSESKRLRAVTLASDILIDHWRTRSHAVGQWIESRRSLTFGLANEALLSDTLTIAGATGTGKDLAAHAIHELRFGPNGSFHKLSLKGLTVSTDHVDFEAALKTCNTLYLDEITDASPSLQGALVSVLERRAEETAVRGLERAENTVIASTTRREFLSFAGRRTIAFREDLAQRLSVGMACELPPLTDRPREDLEEAWAREVMRISGCSIKLDDKARDELVGYEWHGNFTELLAYARRVAGALPPEILAHPDSSTIFRAFQLIRAHRGPPGEVEAGTERLARAIVDRVLVPRPEDTTGSWKVMLDRLQRAVIRELERRVQGDAERARVMGINVDTYRSMRNRLAAKLVTNSNQRRTRRRPKPDETK